MHSPSKPQVEGSVQPHSFLGSEPSEALVQAGRLGEALADLPIAVMSLQSSLGADHPESVFWLIRLAEMSTLSQ